MEIRPIFSALIRSKTGAFLIAAQVALTLAILTNALYVVNERLQMSARPTGVVEDEVFQIRLMPFREVADIERMQIDDREALLAIPGVRDAAWSNQVPLGRSSWNSGMAASRDSAETLNTSTYFSADSLVSALGLDITEGRDFRDDDILVVDPETTQESPRTAIITRALGAALFPGEDSFVGRTVYNGIGDSARPFEVVGVVERLQRPYAPPNNEAEYSLIYPQRYLNSFAAYLVRVEPGALESAMAEAEQVLTSRMEGRVLLDVRPMAEIRANHYRANRALAGMLLAVSALMLLVTASGIVGMASLWVNQRRKQIGVRRAIGALRRDILRYFLVENVMVTTAGILFGLMLAVALNEFLVSRLELPRLPVSYLGWGMLLLWVLGLLAAFGPAWRAAAIPPAIATRSA